MTQEHDSEYDSEFGVLDHPEGRPALRFTRRLAHPPEKVWRALTEPELIAHPRARGPRHPAVPGA